MSNNGLGSNGAPNRSGIEFRIKGGAGPHEAAVITAVLEHALAEERRNGSDEDRPRFTNWTMSRLHTPYHRPRPSQGARINGAARPSAPRRTRPRTS